MLTVARAYCRERQDADADLLDAFARTRHELIGTLTRMLGNRDDALDVLQTTFLKCWRARRRLHDVRNLTAWIYRVALNAGRDLRRDAWRRRARPLRMAPILIAATSSNLLDNESLDRLHNALADLRPAEREVFLLRQHSDCTYDQIAAHCCIPVGTVKTRMRTAIIKLRGVLDEEATD
jgi:RNA polymerase sigma-70 factor (ECF subfamily)